MFRSTDPDDEPHSSKHLTCCIITPNIFSSQKAVVCTAESDIYNTEWRKNLEQYVVLLLAVALESNTVRCG
jgi:hypothetical protein